LRSSTTARAANDRFALSEADLGAIIDICRWLDGIALAIEFAAACVDLMDVHSSSGDFRPGFRTFEKPLRSLGHKFRCMSNRHRQP
jgi:predicted ATPase